MSSLKSCPEGHALCKARASQPLTCDGCASHILGGDWAYACTACDHDLCGPCVGEKRSPQASQATTPSLSVAAVTTPINAFTIFSVGSRVKARYLASTIGAFGTKWFDGTVMACNTDGTYNIAYADGDVEEGVLGDFIKPAPASNPAVAPPHPATPLPGSTQIEEAMEVDESAACSGAQPSELIDLASEESKPEDGQAAEASAADTLPQLPADWGMVESLVRSRGKHKTQRQYLVKWVGHPLSSNTWEKGTRLPKKFVDAFEQQAATAKAAPAKAAPAPAAHPAASSSALGKRKIVPTMVKVGNQFVKRQNMYDMETGERSIFDSEYDGSRDAAFAPRDRPDRAAAAAVASVAPKIQPKPPRETSAGEKRRTSNNEAIKADVAILEERRAHFFAAHSQRIAPFVEKSVLHSVHATCKATPPPPARRPLMAQPESVSGGEMRDYQLAGLDWLVDSYERHGLCPILGDEMGLGKTLQTIAFLAYLKFERKLPGASLVICPLSVLSTWTNELKRWCPALRTVKLHSSDPAERERLKQIVLDGIGSYDVVVTTCVAALCRPTHRRRTPRTQTPHAPRSSHATCAPERRP